jgi:hypothetical protein
MAADESPSLLAFEVGYTAEGGTMGQQREMLDAVVRHGREIIGESRAFRYEPDRRRADHVLYVSVHERGKPNLLMTVLCGLTLCVVPTWSTSTFDVKAELQARNGNALGQRAFQQRLTTIGQVFLLFAMPFRSPQGAVRTLWRNAWVDLADWTHTTVHKPPSPSPSPKRRRGG